MTSRIAPAWFERRLEAVGLNQSELARRLGTNRSTISRVFQGGRPLSLAIARGLAKELKTSLVDIARHADGPDMDMVLAVHLSSTTATLEIVGRVDANFAVEMYPPGAPKKSVTLEINGPIDAQALEYQTAGTDAEMYDGAVCVIGPRLDSNPIEMVGRYNAVWLADGRILLRFVERLDKDGFRLTAVSCEPISAQVISYSRVIAVMGR